MAGNTGYIQYANLELYYPDDNSSAGQTKTNVYGSADYIAPTYSPATCPPSARFYNVERSLVGTRNNCGVGFSGNQVTMVAPANMFVSTISQVDANSLADTYLSNNIQIYANNVGTCTAVSDTQRPTPTTGLYSTGLTETSLTLRWSASTDNVGVTNYLVYMDDVLIATVGNVLAYVISGLTQNTAYSFTVYARDAAGNVSLGGSIYNVTTLATRSMELSQNGLTFYNNGAPVGNAFLNVTANAAWYTLMSNGVDFDIFPTSGTGNEYMDVYCFENTTGSATGLISFYWSSDNAFITSCTLDKFPFGIEPF